MRRELEIKTADGIANAWIFQPDSKSKEGIIPRPVLFFMDAMGPRQALFEMAQRLADSGHFVLLPDLFYRFGTYGPFDGTSFANETSRAEILKMLRETTYEMTTRDTSSFLHVMQKEGAAGPVAAVGYCM